MLSGSHSGGHGMAISINLYLDTRHIPVGETESTAEFPVKISITKDGSTSYLPTGVRIKADNWKNGRVTGRPDKARLNTLLQNMQSNVMSIILESRSNGLYAGMTVTEIKNDVSNRLGDQKSPVVYFMSLFDSFAEKRNSERTKEIYRITAKKIRALFPRADRISLDAIDLTWLETFDELLIAKGNNSSTRSLDFRNIRAVIMDAKKHRLIRENPFEEFVIPKGESPNRVLTVAQLQTFFQAEVKPWEQKYLDFFKLSFYLIGINTEDLLHVRCIEEGRINYIRAKTGEEMSIKVEPEGLEIIERYRGKKYLLNIFDTYSNTHNWTSKVDAVLKDISNRNGLPPITMYWARHTWATIAHADVGIDIGTISEALGHQPEKKVTLIYIRKKDYTKVDTANREVIKLITPDNN